MPEALVEDLETEMRCEDLLDCIHGLAAIDEDCFRLLTEVDGWLTVDEIAEQLDCGRTTAYRAAQRLLEAGFFRRKQVAYDDGGYYHSYRAQDPEEIADDMLRIMNEWCVQTGELINEFRSKYGDDSTAHASVGD